MYLIDSVVSRCLRVAIFPKKSKNNYFFKPRMEWTLSRQNKKKRAKSQISLDFSPSLCYAIYQQGLLNSIRLKILEIQYIVTFCGFEPQSLR